MEAEWGPESEQQTEACLMLWLMEMNSWLSGGMYSSLSLRVPRPALLYGCTFNCPYTDWLRPSKHSVPIHQIYPSIVHLQIPNLCFVLGIGPLLILCSIEKQVNIVWWRFSLLGVQIWYGQGSGIGFHVHNVNGSLPLLTFRTACSMFLETCFRTPDICLNFS